MLQIQHPMNNSRPNAVGYGYKRLRVGYAVPITLGDMLQVALCLNSMMICGLIHASIMKTGHDYVSEEQEAEFMAACRDFALK